MVLAGDVLNFDDAWRLGLVQRRGDLDDALAWAADELAHTAGTLDAVTAEDAEYEMELVLAEIRQRLSLMARASDPAPRGLN